MRKARKRDMLLFLVDAATAGMRDEEAVP